MKCFFFESVGVPGGSPELRKGNSGWVPSTTKYNIVDQVFQLGVRIYNHLRLTSLFCIYDSFSFL